jgi:phosphatidylglycerol:prolipoprotein diacylglycerol transferase
VVADLVRKEGIARFLATVPAPIRQRNLEDVGLSAELEAALGANGFEQLGDVLLRWPFGPASLGLNKADHAELGERLAALPGVQPEWFRDAPWRQWNPEHVWNGLLWCLLLAVIGARLYHVFTPSPSMAEVGINSPADYFRNPMQLINLRRGGLGIYGGIAGGAIGLFAYSRRHRLSALQWADVAVIGVALGQFVGRWGNFFNQELYGRPTSVPWAVWIDPAYRLTGYTAFSRFHPAFLYESLWNLLAFLILITLWKRYRRRLMAGDIMAGYLILYGIGRILMETVRLDSRSISFGALEVNLPIATVVSLVVAVVMAAWVILRHGRRADAR